MLIVSTARPYLAEMVFIARSGNLAQPAWPIIIIIHRASEKGEFSYYTTERVGNEREIAWLGSDV